MTIDNTTLANELCKQIVETIRRRPVTDLDSLVYTDLRESAEFKEIVDGDKFNTVRLQLRKAISNLPVVIDVLYNVAESHLSDGQACDFPITGFMTYDFEIERFDNVFIVKCEATIETTGTLGGVFDEDLTFIKYRNNTLRLENAYDELNGGIIELAVDFCENYGLDTDEEIYKMCSHFDIADESDLESIDRYLAIGYVWRNILTRNLVALPEHAMKIIMATTVTIDA